MRTIKTFVIILLAISPSYGQNFTLQDTVFKEGDVLISHDIHFDFNKAIIRPENFAFLDSVSSFLLTNRNLIVEVSCHCDERFSDKYSTCLTCRRAKAIADYIILKGVKPYRLVAKGYNDEKPLIVGARTEEEHEKNRRTEFAILRTDYSE